MNTLRLLSRRVEVLSVVVAYGALASLPSKLTAQPQGAPPAGELTEQQRLRAQSPGGGLTPGVELPRWPQSASRPGSPVTDAMLASPSPNDWLSWRGTRDGHGF